MHRTDRYTDRSDRSRPSSHASSFSSFSSFFSTASWQPPTIKLGSSGCTQDVCRIYATVFIVWGQAYAETKHRYGTQAWHVRCFSPGFPFELGKFHKPQICKSTRASHKKPRRVALGEILCGRPVGLWL